MPVYVMGRDSSQSPLSLGSVESGLSFHWTLGKLGVLEILPRHTRVTHKYTHSHTPPEYNTKTHTHTHTHTHAHTHTHIHIHTHTHTHRYGNTRAHTHVD